MNTFSFRAECSCDTDELLKLLGKFGIPYTVQHSDRGDVQMLAYCSLGELQNIVRRVPDGHVLLQTLRECPLKDNDLERDWELH